MMMMMMMMMMMVVVVLVMCGENTNRQNTNWFCPGHFWYFVWVVLYFLALATPPLACEMDTCEMSDCHILGVIQSLSLFKNDSTFETGFAVFNLVRFPD